MAIPASNPGSLITAPDNKAFTVNWEHSTPNNFHIEYEHLDKYANERSIRYTNIGIPFYQRSQIAQTYQKNYNLKNEKNAVAFFVEGRPYDSPEGRKLVCKTFEELVNDPLRWDHEPRDATITYFEKDDVPKIRRDIHHCIITGAELHIVPKDNMVVLRFHLLGLMEKDI